MDFQADITLLPRTSITILTGTIGTRTSIIIRTPEIHMPIIPLRQPIGTLRIGLITTDIILITASKSE